MPLVNTYTDIIQGGITSTGNTVSMSGNNSASFGQEVFVTTDNSKQVTGFPAGTTTNYTENSSNAFLNIPPGSTIVYAELMWTAVGNFTTPVLLTTPNQSNISISPTRNDVYAPFNLYWHSARVESQVQAGGSGLYTVGSVQATYPFPTGVGPSWTLVVAYRNPTFKTRYITINTGLSNVQGTPGNTFTITNFVTPSGGPLKGYLLMAYVAGDFGDGANLRVGPTTASYTNIGNPGPVTSAWNGNAPYNPQGQMFPGLICVADPENPNIGLIDTRGTNGSNNVSAYAPQNYGINSRTLYDLAGFDISSTLVNNQNQLNVNVFFTGAGGAVIQNESVQIDINAAEIRPVKSVDKGTGNQNDTLTYTVVIKNTGTTTANNVVFLDTIPTFTTFIPNSVTINGVSNSGNPQTGVSIGTIGVNEVKTITFRVTINGDSVPSVFTVNNTGNVSFSYDIGGTIPPVNAYSTSNTVTTTVTFLVDKLKATKFVNKGFTSTNSGLVYTIVIENTITNTVSSVQILDTIPNGVIYNTNSLTIDGVTSVQNLPNITLTNIGPLQRVTLTFTVSVPNNIISNPIFNSAVLVTRTQGLNTNIVATTISFASVVSEKFVDKNFTTLLDTITYTLVYKNTGNVSVNNLVIVDTLPIGINFISNSVTINNVQTAMVNPNPPGITILQGIGPLGVLTVTFQAKVVSSPNPNPFLNNGSATFSYTVDPAMPNGMSGGTNTNVVSTLVNFVSVTGEKFVDKNFASMGDTITYTLVYKNSGNVSANNVVVVDTLPQGINFIENSIVVDNIQVPGARPNPPGITLSNGIGARGVVTITFKARVIGSPTQNPFINYGVANFTYTVDPNRPNNNSSGANTNGVSTKVTIVDVRTTKFVDRLYADCNDIINYVVAVRNNGNDTIYNNFFTDTIPAFTTFVNNSVFVDGVPMEGGQPVLGFMLPNIAVNGIVTVRFAVKVNCG